MADGVVAAAETARSTSSASVDAASTTSSTQRGRRRSPLEAPHSATALELRPQASPAGNLFGGASVARSHVAALANAARAAPSATEGDGGGARLASLAAELTSLRAANVALATRVQALEDSLHNATSLITALWCAVTGSQPTEPAPSESVAAAAAVPTLHPAADGSAALARRDSTVAALSLLASLDGRLAVVERRTLAAAAGSFTLTPLATARTAAATAPATAAEAGSQTTVSEEPRLMRPVPSRPAAADSSGSPPNLGSAIGEASHALAGAAPRAFSPHRAMVHARDAVPPGGGPTSGVGGLRSGGPLLPLPPPPPAALAAPPAVGRRVGAIDPVASVPTSVPAVSAGGAAPAGRSDGGQRTPPHLPHPQPAYTTAAAGSRTEWHVVTPPRSVASSIASAGGSPVAIVQPASARPPPAPGAASSISHAPRHGGVAHGWDGRAIKPIRLPGRAIEATDAAGRPTHAAIVTNNPASSPARAVAGGGSGIGADEASVDGDAAATLHRPASSRLLTYVSRITGLGGLPPASPASLAVRPGHATAPAPTAGISSGTEVASRGRPDAGAAGGTVRPAVLASLGSYRSRSVEPAPRGASGGAADPRYRGTNRASSLDPGGGRVIAAAAAAASAAGAPSGARRRSGWW